MALSALGSMVFAYPLFWCLIEGNIVLFQMVFSILAGGFGAAIHDVMSDLYPVSQRCRAISVGFSIGISLFGGTSPFISAWLVQATGFHTAPVVYVMFVAALGLWSILSATPAYDPLREPTFN